jgi:hypothetical protein
VLVQLGAADGNRQQQPGEGSDIRFEELRPLAPTLDADPPKPGCSPTRGR